MSDTSPRWTAEFREQTEQRPFNRRGNCVLPDVTCTKYGTKWVRGGSAEDVEPHGNRRVLSVIVYVQSGPASRYPDRPYPPSPTLEKKVESRRSGKDCFAPEGQPGTHLEKWVEGKGRRKDGRGLLRGKETMYDESELHWKAERIEEERRWKFFCDPFLRAHWMSTVTDEKMRSKVEKMVVERGLPTLPEGRIVTPEEFKEHFDRLADW